MDFTAYRLRVDGDARENAPAARAMPRFTWAARHGEDGRHQSAYRLTVSDGAATVYDSGRVESEMMHATYAGAPLSEGKSYRATLTLWDDRGQESRPAGVTFFSAAHTFCGRWIDAAEIESPAAKYFYRGFSLSTLPVRAMLYTAAAGYARVTLNGRETADSFLDPAISNYERGCYYTVADVTALLTLGQNGLFLSLGDGWRHMHGYFTSYSDRFFGRSAARCDLVLWYADGRCETMGSDESWLACPGAVIRHSVFDGETHDARKTPPRWGMADFTPTPAMRPAVPAGAPPAGEMMPQTLPPVRVRQAFSARAFYRLPDGSYIYDFGQNLAGVCRLSLPHGMEEGHEISVTYAEEILPNGDLDRETLRQAKPCDTYIAGKEDPPTWTPAFTYHGFRYAKLSGYPGLPEAETLTALAFCNEIKNASYFRCGSAVINALQDCILQTEQNNLHHMASDCPQRDERMGWLNDATVRFEAMPYHFRCGRLFRKILQDIAHDQLPGGEIGDTTPYLWGKKPADPVCSSYLVAVEQLFLHEGDEESMRTYYPGLCAWTDCLSRMRNEEGIIEYSLYGDWAGPADCCDRIFDGCQSSVTPPALMSSGYYYYNCASLSRMAAALGLPQESEEWHKRAEEAREAFCRKWYDPRLSYVANGSQGAQAFALWLGILPKEDEVRAARRMNEAVKNAGYRLTTGNLTSRYLLDMLARFGYADSAYRLLTREEYPSLGYMLQNGATTVWERFERKWGSGMNSHDHPMYGACSYFFYAYLLGLSPLSPGWARAKVSPVFPEGLSYAEGQVETPHGEIYTRWQRDGEDGIDLLLSLPFGTEAEVSLPGMKQTVTSGLHHFHIQKG